MKPFSTNIENATLRNNRFRKVLYTTPTMQLVLMSLKPGEEIGSEVHPYTTQFIRVESGSGIAIMGNERKRLRDGISVVIPPGTRHNVTNTSKTEPLKLYTLYSPPEHPAK